MKNPMSSSFGRTDTSRGSSVDITQINGSTKRCENRCVGASGDARTEYNHVWSLRRTDIDFGSRYDVLDALILKTGEMDSSSKGVFDLLIRMVPSDSRQTVPFGRYELFFAQICEYTKYHENRVVGAPGHGQSNTTIFGRPDASMSVSVAGIMFRTRRFLR